MPYTSYNAYIVQSNGAVVLAMVILNYLVFSFHIWPLTYIFDAMFVQCLGKNNRKRITWACSNRVI